MFGRRRKQNGHNGATTEGTDRQNSEYLIELRDVIKVFKTPAGDFSALRGVDLHVGGGEFVAVIGKSGSGKSTLINMIAGIDRPTSGEVFVGDTAVHKLNEGQMAVWRGRNLGIIFQFFQLLPTLTVIENIMLPMDFARMYSPRERRERAMYLLDLVGLGDQAHKLPTAISGGQQQRVAIARALANDPPILVADEPTGNLDSRTAEAVFELFESLVSEGKTVLMVTHDDDQAKRVTRTVIISDGEIVNEYLAKALPSLGHDLLGKATRKLQPLTFPPGADIITEGADPERFYIVSGGGVEVLISGSYGHKILVERFGVGQYFGEIELMQGGQYIATIRADRYTGAEVMTLDRETFNSLVGESARAKAAIQRTVAERLAQHEAAEQEGQEKTDA